MTNKCHTRGGQEIERNQAAVSAIPERKPPNRPRGTVARFLWRNFFPVFILFSSCFHPRFILVSSSFTARPHDARPHMHADVAGKRGLLANYFSVATRRSALARMEGDTVEHADLHADFSELRKPPSLPTQRCASFAFSRTRPPPAQLSLWRTGW